MNQVPSPIRNLVSLAVWLAAALSFFTGFAPAQVPGLLSYQGRITAAGTNFSGAGQFKFALVDSGRAAATRQATASITIGSLGAITAINVLDGGHGYLVEPLVSLIDPQRLGRSASARAIVANGQVTSIQVVNAGQFYSPQTYAEIARPSAQIVIQTYWSNDGTSASGGEPAAAVMLPVAEGLFNVHLGDVTLTNMISIPSSIFTNSDLQLRIWFSDGIQDFVRLAPDQRLASAAYAHMAAGLPLQSVTSQHIAPGSVAGIHLAASAVAASNLAPGALSHLDAPDGSPSGALTVDAAGLVGIGTTTPEAGLHITTGAPLTVLQVLSQRRDEEDDYRKLNGALQAAVAGNLAAIVAPMDNAVTLVDFTNPFSPVLRSQIWNNMGNSFTNLLGAYSAVWAGSNLVVAAATLGEITVIGASNPASPVRLAALRDDVGGWNELRGAKALSISGNLLAIGSSADNAVTLAGMANPSQPVLQGVMEHGFNGFTNLNGVSSVALSGSLLVIGAQFSQAVTLVDVSDPSNPQKRSELRQGVGSFTNLADISSVALSGNLLAIAAHASDTVTLVDVANPANPVKLAEIRNGVDGFDIMGPSCVTLANNYLAIAATYSESVTLADVSNPIRPVLLARAKDNLNGAFFLRTPSGVVFAGTNLLVTAAGDSAFTLFGNEMRQAALASTGWVGIGTTRPAAPLHVVGNLIVEDAEHFDVDAVRVELGYVCQASTAFALALGSFTIASGQGSVALGYDTVANSAYSMALGKATRASGYGSAAMGFSTVAEGDYSTAMGLSTRASGYGATTMGMGTVASGQGATALGSDATASGWYATAMGYNTVANGSSSTAMGEATVANGFASVASGNACVASNNYTFAAGNRAQALHKGSFVWADSTAEIFASSATNQFLIRADRVGIGTNAPQEKLHVNGRYILIQGQAGEQAYFGANGSNNDLELGSFNAGVTNIGFWNTGAGRYMNLYADKIHATVVPPSDRNVKTAMEPVDSRMVLDQVLALPVQRWSYTNSPSVRHLGPMAQDFKASFGLGDTDQGINTVDADGVALAAIQGLNQKLEARARQLEAENAKLKQRLERLEQWIRQSGQ